MLSNKVRAMTSIQLDDRLRNIRIILSLLLVAFTLTGVIIVAQERTFVSVLMFVFGNIPTVLYYRFVFKPENQLIQTEIKRRARINRMAKQRGAL